MPAGDAVTTGHLGVGELGAVPCQNLGDLGVGERPGSPGGAVVAFRRSGFVRHVWYSFVYRRQMACAREGATRSEPPIKVETEGRAAQRLP